MPAPVNTVAPAITGDAIVGGLLTLSDGTWTGGVDAYAYAWARDGVAIPGATHSTYTVAFADIAAAISASVMATNVDGSTVAAATGGGTIPSTLTVEDGTGLPTADSYVSIDTADAYHLRIGNAAWAAATGADREAALRRATQYIDSKYQFRGEPLEEDQALAWPRTIDGETPPWPVKRLSGACCELALRALAAPLFADQTGGEVVSETVGPISVTYAQAGLGGQTRFAGVDALLAPYTAGGARSTIRIERAS